MKHTPGPWFFCEWFRSPNHKKAKLSDHWTITGSSKRSADDGHDIAKTYSEANARLIAAAPELLGFVQQCLELGIMVPEAKALIAKAEGGVK